MISWNKNKSKINLIIDAIMFLALMAIAGLGFLIKFVLIPGYKRNVLYPGDVELYFMNLTRHEWGRIHLILGYIFLFLLLLHVILHWNMIKSIFRQLFSGKAIRTIAALSFGTVCFFLSLAPLIMKPEVAPSQVKHIHRKTMERLTENDPGKLPAVKQKTREEIHQNQDNHEGGTERLHKNAHRDIEVFGYMTLNEVATKHDVDIADLTKALNIPTSLSNHRIGRLRRQYDFHNHEIREAILKIKGD